jgi:hypothetical protein
VTNVTDATVVAVLTPTLTRLLPTILPPGARAVTLEVRDWLVTVRVFVAGAVDDHTYEDLEREIEPILNDLGYRDDAGWDLHLMLVRQDPPRPVRALGTVVWASTETTVESLNPS